MKAGTREWRKAMCLRESVCPENEGGRKESREGGRGDHCKTRVLFNSSSVMIPSVAPTSSLPPFFLPPFLPPSPIPTLESAW